MSLPTILTIIGLTAAIGLIFWRKYQRGKFKVYHGVPIPKKFPLTLTTAGGVTVKSVVPVPTYVQNWIDAGIQKQIDCVERLRPYWDNYRSLRDYTVFIIEPMGFSSDPSPLLNGAPILTVADGRNASATNLGTGGDGYPVPTVVIPHQHQQDWHYDVLFRNGVRFETEHIVCWMNDQRLFWEYTNANDRHPIFPDENGQ